MGQGHSEEKGPRSSGELSPQQKDALSKARSRVATEIWESEKVYVKRLEALVKLYKKPLMRAAEDKKPLLPEEAIPAIFANIEDILALQEKILYELEGRINKWSDKQIIGDIFVANADALKLYVAYVNNYDNALITIRTHSKENPKFKEFLKESIAREAGDAQDIHSLLITAVQRPPRYCLLLKELLKNTPESHKDRRNVAAALEAVEKAAEYINAQKMIAEGHERSLKIKSMFQNKIAFVSTTGATIVYEGEIKAHKRGKLFVVVFDNYFLVGEEKTGLLGRKKSKFEPLVWIPLSQVKLTPASETSLTLNFGDTDAAPSPKSRTSSVAVAPAASSSGTSSAAMASSSPSLTVTASSSQPAPTFILTTTTLLFNWENHETLQAWMAAVLEAQTKLSKPKEDGRSRGSSIFSWLKW